MQHRIACGFRGGAKKESLRAHSWIAERKIMGCTARVVMNVVKVALGGLKACSIPKGELQMW